MESPHTFEQFASAAAVEAYLTETAVQQYSSLFGQPGSGYYYPFHRGQISLAAPVSFTSIANFAEDTTNVQVAGVDEADLVETDGEFLYQVNGQTLTIMDVRDPADLEIATQLTITPPWESQNSQAQSSTGGTDSATARPVEPFFPIGGPMGGWNNIDGMYFQGDRLTVISTGWSPAEAATDSQSASLSLLDWLPPGQPQVQVTVLDVADPTEVSIVETSLLEGSLISSRALGDEVVVVTSNGFQLPAPLVIPDEGEDDQAQNHQAQSDQAQGSQVAADTQVLRLWPYPYPSGTYETQEVYLERIKDQVLELGLPNVNSFDGEGQVVGSGLLTAPSDIYKPVTEEPWQQLTTVSTFDVGDDHLGVDESVALATPWTQEVFVSKQYLYLLRSSYNGGTYSTHISQLDLETSELLAVGEVPGAIDNQFSVDEQDGFLRISTTTGFGNASLNNIYVLDQVDSQLEVVGKIEGLAPGERIFSTRFQGDYGFVVTFRQIDPLFALDLSDPHNPKVAGELKIPGFSEYLQVIHQGEQTLLLGIGRDADPTTGRAQALKVSLFDVTDLANPIEVDNYIFEGDYSSSEALWNHKAVTYIPEQKLLAIPNQQYDRNSFTNQNQLTVFKVDGQRGIDRIGDVDHSSDWINRSVSIDGDLFAVSGQQISAYDVPDLKLLNQVSWDVDLANKPFAIPLSADLTSIVWNTQTGAVSSLALDAGAAITSLKPLGRSITDENWALQTSGDMDGDGQKDALLRHALAGQNLVLYMNSDGQSIKSEALIGRDVPDLNWSITGTGDMNGDGHVDIVLHNPVADQIVAWYMDGAGNILSEGLVGRGFGDSHWKIGAIADFNGDDKADMLLRHELVGQHVLWEMDGGAILAESLFGRDVPDRDWHVEGARDFDGNGTTDVFWRHRGVGQGLVWSMADKNTIAAEILLTDLPDGLTQMVT